MSTLEPPNVQQGAEQASQPGQQQQAMAQPPGASPSMGNVPGLPPTALSMQMQSLNDQYAQARDQAMGAQMAPDGTGGPLMLDQRGGGLGQGQFARTSLQDMAERLARSYGLNFGRGSLIDEEGNFLQTPDQLAAAGGSELDTTAASMNRVAQALNDRQIEMQQDKATAALQAGLGQVQQRGRGSLAALQSGFYQTMAQNYTDPNLLPEQADFSYWIQKAGFEEAAMNREQELKETGGPTATTTPGTTGSAPAPTTKPDAYKDNVSVSGPEGKGDVVASGPHAGERPVYTYDPISKTTTVSWEKA